MKRLLLILPLIFLMTACSAKPAEIKKDFKATAVCEYNGEVLKAGIASQNHILKIKMIKPKNLKGLSFKYKGSKLTIHRDGLKLKADESYLPNNAFSSVINNVINSINHNEINYNGQTSNYAEYNGKCESGSFAITADYNTGFIKSIVIKKLGLNAEFTQR